MEDNTTITNAAAVTPVVKKTTISIAEVISLLHSGYTRTTSSTAYNSEIGCIQDYYGLSDDDVKLLFTHPKLKKVRTKQPSKNINDVFNIIDNVESTTTETNGEFDNEVVE